MGQKGFTGFGACFDALQTEFDRQYCVEFNPTAGVMSSILSQEVIKVLTGKDHPVAGMAVYDSANQ